MMTTGAAEMSIQRRIERLEEKRGKGKLKIRVRWPHEPEFDPEPGAEVIKLDWGDDPEAEAAG